MFERVADRDYSPRVMAVRRVTSLQFGPLLTLPLPSILPNCDIIVIYLVKPLLRCTFMTNPRKSPTYPSDPNTRDPAVVDLNMSWSNWA